MEHHAGCPASVPGCDDRWLCARTAEWTDRFGRGPWGALDDQPDRLNYLATMSAAEHSALVQIAFDNLDSGCWQGFASANGGYEDGPPWNLREAAWRASARDFMEQVAAGEPSLTEGMLAYATGDLSRELAWLRGWCPGT